MEADHHDPWGEGTQRGLERLMALGVLAEAGSRLVAENARARAQRAEQDVRDRTAADRNAARERRRAAAADTRRARQWARFAGNRQRLREYVSGLTLVDLAAHWGHADAQADTDPTAAAVLEAAESELRRRWPGLADLYDRRRDSGAARHEAMADAVNGVWFGGAGTARAHGGRPPTAGALPVLGEELAREVVALAGELDAVGAARLRHNLADAGWSPHALAQVDVLLQRTAAGREAAEAAGDPTAIERSPGSVPEAAGGRASDAGPATATATTPGTAARSAAESFPVPAGQALTSPSATGPMPVTTSRPTLRRTR
ncbi:hypothetical protein O7627_27560 [Solwaraspora sp. WMMD1047]|uniref:hypothetical protein n=1 Tax=Solwaraspora sp. WMMD1047 TaxID=3016102 RepID=UPI002417513D|nr:hypothetical protein [Solwaraspora sp. WMMD1047]MDG4833035.1 hypothetical protein [Solwaraspora sp. WMMD1047]